MSPDHSKHEDCQYSAKHAVVSTASHCIQYCEENIKGNKCICNVFYVKEIFRIGNMFKTPKRKSVTKPKMSAISPAPRATGQTLGSPYKHR